MLVNNIVNFALPRLGARPRLELELPISVVVPLMMRSNRLLLEGLLERDLAPWIRDGVCFAHGPLGFRINRGELDRPIVDHQTAGPLFSNRPKVVQEEPSGDRCISRVCAKRA